MRIRSLGFRLALIALFCGALAACDSAEERVQRHYERALELIAEGAPEKASLELRNALKLNDRHAPSRFELGRIYEQQGEFAAALGNYRIAAEQDPGNMQAHLRLARLLLLGGDADGADEAATAALALAPDDPEALAVKAGTMFRKGDRAEAVRLANRALAVDPDNTTANVVLITERYMEGDSPAALAKLDALLAKAPKDLTLHLLKIRILSASPDREALIAHLKSAIADLPDQLEFRRMLAQMLIAKGDTEGAEAEMRALADAAAADDPGPALDLVNFLFTSRGADAARAEIAARVAGAKDPAVAFRFRGVLADIERRDGHPDEARKLLRAMIEDSPPDLALQAKTQLAGLELAEGDIAAARSLAEEVLAKDAANVDALAIRADVALRGNDVSAAIVDLRQAMELAPEDLRLMLLAARAYERDGSEDLAAERLATATRVSQYNPQIAARYAAMLSRRGQIEGAETVLSEAVARSPQNTMLLGALAQMRIRLKNYAGAEEIITRLAALDNGAVAAQQLEAAALSAQGKFGESLDALQKLADEPNGEAAALTGIVATYVRSGDMAAAETVIDDVLAEDPRNVRALLLRAELHLMRGDRPAAERRLRDIVAAHPAEPIGYLSLARLQMGDGDPATAEKTAREGLKAAPGDSGLRVILAQALEMSRNYDAAIAEYAALYESNPDAIAIANNYASLLAEHRADDPESVARAVEVARRLRSVDMPEMQDTYGWTLFLSGDVEGAVRVLAPAAEALPQNAIVQYHAGKAFAALSRPAEARKHLEAALSVDPNFPMAEAARQALETLPPATP